MPRFDILSYGTIGLDIIIRVPHLPHPDRSTHATRAYERLGGKATNTAAHLAAWGLKVAVSGTVIGEDQMGDKVMGLIARYPTLSAHYVARKRGLESMYCCILVTPDGERAIIGVNVESNPQTPPTPEMIGDARILTLDLYGSQERVAAASLAREAHVPVVIGDLRTHDHPVLPYTDVAITSGAEIRQQYPGMALAEFAARVLAWGVSGLIVTHGPDAVIVFAGQDAPQAVQPTVVNMVDATGAGDAFRAGVTFGMLQGLPLVDCAALGAAAGSLHISRPQDSDAPATLEAVTALARSLAISPAPRDAVHDSP